MNAFFKSMSRRTRAGVLTAACLCGVCALPTAHAADPAPSDQDALNSLKDFSNGSKALYHRLAHSLIRVRIDVNRDAILTDDFHKELTDFGSAHGNRFDPSSGGTVVIAPGPAGGPPNDRDADHDHGPRGDHDHGDRPDHPDQGFGGGPAHEGDNGPPSMDGHHGPGGDANMIRHFFEQRQSMMDPESLARMRLLMMRMDATRSGQPLDFLGFMIDDKHALVLFPLVKYTDNKPYTVVLPDGSTTTATLEASDYLRGVAVITLSPDLSPGNAPIPIPIAATAPDPGELLLSVGSSREALTWTLASELTPRKTREGADIHAFSVRAMDDRGSAFLINTSGELSSFAFDRLGVPYESFRPIVNDLVKGISQNQGVKLGLKYAWVPQSGADREKNSVLGIRPALRVTDVEPGSLSDTAGIKSGDFLLTINHSSITQWPRIMTDLANPPAEIPLGIVRDNQEQTVTVKTTPAATPTPGDAVSHPGA